MFQAAGIQLSARSMKPPVGRVEVSESIAERSHVQYLAETCLTSEEELVEHGQDLGK